MKGLRPVTGLLLILGASASAADTKLWYDRPAGNWETEALPIGSGRLGAMLFGGTSREHIQFNEESLWIGDESLTGAYQAFGDVFVELSHGAVTAYRRELDLERAVHTVMYASDGVKYRREAFASFPAKVMVCRLTADKPGSLTGSVALTDQHKGRISAEGNRIQSSGSLAGYRYAPDNNKPYAIALNYEAQVLVLNDGGTVEVVGDRVRFKQANSVTLSAGGRCGTRTAFSAARPAHGTSRGARGARRTSGSTTPIPATRSICARLPIR